MNCARKALTILLTVLITQSVFGQLLPGTESRPPMILPPQEMMENFLRLDDGRMVLYFDEAEWTELSRLMWEDRVETAMEAVKEAVIPLLAEVEELKRQRNRLRLFAWGGITVGAGSLLLAVLLH